MHPPRLTVGALALVAIASCRPQGSDHAPASLSDADRQAIQSVSDRFRQHLVARELDSLSTLYTEDAVVMPPNHAAITGKNEIRQWQQGYPPIADFALNNEQIEGVGDLAYVRGRYVMQVTGAPADTGKFVEIRRRQPDGSWRIAVDMFNSNLAPPEPPKP